jgi:HEPN domain-containing protein
LAVIKTRESAPMIHDLERLALLAKIEITEEIRIGLKLITQFNIAGRYDDEKFAFYKKCTKEYVEKNLQICKKIFLWLKKLYQ